MILGVSPVCASLELDPVRFAIDGSAEQLRALVQVAAHANKIASQRKGCALTPKKTVRRWETVARESYLRIWEVAWGTVPRKTFECTVRPEGVCSEFVTSAATSDLTALTTQISTGVTRVLGKCKGATRTTQRIEKRRKMLVGNVATSIAAIPESIDVCN